jgi:hypothetical protein
VTVDRLHEGPAGDSHGSARLLELVEMLAQGRRRVQLGVAIPKVSTGALDPFVVHGRASSGRGDSGSTFEPLPILTVGRILMLNSRRPADRVDGRQ